MSAPLRFVGQLALVAGLMALFLAALESWIFFGVFLAVMGFIWWYGARRRHADGASTFDK